MARMDAERKRRLMALDSKYKVYVPYERDRCSYCGDHADTLDHCPALKVAEGLDLDKFRGSGGRLLKVPACSQCNRWLAARPIYTLPDRKQYILKRWEQTFREKFAIPKWSVEELAELGPTLRRFVDDHDGMANWVRRRIEFARLAI